MRLLALLTATLTALTLPACKTATGGSEAKDSAAGPAAVRPSWLLSPEQIEATVRETWGLDVSDEEAQRYFGAVHTLLGGTSVVRRTTLLSRPHELYILTLDSLSAWVADKLTARQVALEHQTAAPDQFVFQGFTVNGLNVSDKIADAALCQACYADDSQPWCDCADGLTVGALGAARLSPQALTADAPGPGVKAWRKRLMHNMQDIGDFLMCGVGSIDNLTPMAVSGRPGNVTQDLVDAVFLPGWARAQGQGLAAGEAERRAWSSVIHTILMGQGCFMNLASTAR